MLWKRLLLFRRRKSSSNRRRFRRCSYHASVHCGPEQLEPTRSVDLSEGGVGLLCPTSMEVGSHVAMAFLNMGVSVEGTVRAVQPGPQARYRIGIEFDRPEREIVDVVLKWR